MLETLVHQTGIAGAAQRIARLEDIRVRRVAGHIRENAIVSVKNKRLGRKNARVGQLIRLNRCGCHGERLKKAGSERERARNQVRAVHGKKAVKRR